MLLYEKLITMTELAENVRRWGTSAHLVTEDETVMVSLAKLLNDESLTKGAFVFRFSGGPLRRPTSADIAEIGARKLLAGEAVSPEGLDANYLRRSDAEIFFKGPR